jgi:hypothetical protein
MKIIIKLITRGKDAKQNILTIEGHIKDDITTTDDLKNLWDMERAINENTNMRCHVDVTE